jgi:hypothetical protein
VISKSCEGGAVRGSRRRWPPSVAAASYGAREDRRSFWLAKVAPFKK